MPLLRWTPRRLKAALNLYPPYLGAGIRVISISSDWRELQVRMKLRWYNRNAVGTHFGGSLYAMVDPHLMLMLMQILGPEFVVWDQAAKIDFCHPGRGTVTARVHIGDEEVQGILRETAAGEPFRPVFVVTVTDSAEEEIAVIEKTLYVRRRQAPSLPASRNDIE